EPVARAGLVEAQIDERGDPVHRRDGGRATEGAAPRVVAERYRHAPREAWHRIPRRVERGHLDRRVDRRAGYRVRRLDDEGQLRGGARREIGRATVCTSDTTGSRSDAVARGGKVEAHDEGCEPTHRPPRRGAAWRAAGG